MKHRLSRTLPALACIFCLVLMTLSGCATEPPVPQSSQDVSSVVVEEEPPVQTEEMKGDWPKDFSLREAYKDYFMLGTIYTENSLSGKDMELTLKHFDTITPENLMKPEYMQPTNGNFNFTQADTMMGFAQKNSLNVVGHTLVWHQQSGDWLGRTKDRNEAIEQLKSHITNVAGKYKGQITSWDVVNEAVEDNTTLPEDGDWTKCLRKTQWLESIGSDYIEMAFQFAHEADPNAKLYYNDYNLDSKNKADIVYAMVKDLRAKGVPIDGIGMQGHYTLDTSAKSVKSNIEMFASLGVEVSITELDIGVTGANPSAGLTEEQEIKQAVLYARLFKVFKECKDSVARVTFWGYVDNKSWRSDRFPCLFNADYSPKHAAYAVLDPEKYLEMYDTEEATPVRVAEAKYGTPVIDAEIDEIWNSCKPEEVNVANMAWEGAKGTVRMLWDESFVYVLFEVRDSVLNKLSENVYEHDSIELFLDQNNDKGTFYGPDDGQYRVNFEGEESFGTIPDKAGFKSAAKIVDGGYLIEVAIPLVVTPKEGMKMGFDAQVNDSDENGARVSIMKFCDPTNNSYQSPEKWGELLLVK